MNQTITSAIAARTAFKRRFGRAWNLAHQGIKKEFVNLGIMEEEKETSNETSNVVVDDANGLSKATSKESGKEKEGDTVSVSDPVEQLAAVAAERDKLADDVKDLQNLLLRRQAEFDNFRKRIDREKMELSEYASMGAVNAILPIIDDFDRALKVECADKEYSKGMLMIRQRLFESLEKLGLEPIVSEGEKFDPNLHHAVSKAESAEHADDTVLEEYQKGYNFKGRVLRPAMVKVSVKA